MYTCILCRFISAQQILIGCNCWPCSSSSHCKSHLWEACDLCCACHTSYNGTSQPILHLLHHWTQQRGLHKGLSISVLLGPLPLLGMVENMVNLRGLNIFYFYLRYPDSFIWRHFVVRDLLLIYNVESYVNVSNYYLLWLPCGMQEFNVWTMWMLNVPHSSHLFHFWNKCNATGFPCFDYFVYCICF